MASSRIRPDQENLHQEFRPKQQPSTNTMAAPQKRSVLSNLCNINSNKEAGKSKQPFGPSKGKSNTVGNNIHRNIQKPKAPVVPVAQFEAFKVYEDEENKQEEDEFVPDEDEEFDNREVVKNGQHDFNYMRGMPGYESDALPDELEEVSPRTPMSLEKSINEELYEENVTIYHRNEKDSLFEIEEYRPEIYAYMREHELKNRPKHGYILKQPDVTENMRAVLVDWLVEVVLEYKMQTETLYLAVNFIDRFLSYMSVVRAKLQLVGTAAMFLASKYEEVMPPAITEFVYITDDTYDKHQVIRMEQLILRVLHFDLSVPTPLSFITCMCVGAKITSKVEFLAMYLTELSLLEVSTYLQFLPSTLAASSIALARHTLFEDAWSPLLEEITGYSLIQLQDCIGILYETFVKAPHHQQRAIPDKYKMRKYGCVSKIIPRNEMIMFE